MLATRFSRITLVLLFLTALWLPLLVMLTTPQQKVSQAEKRRLAAAPVFSLATINKYAGSFEKYYNDHFGLRRPLVQAYNYIRVKFFKASGTEWVLVGKDGWLFHGGDHIKDMRNAAPYQQSQLERWGEILTQKQKWLEAQGIKYLFLFTPNKNLMYPEQLPPYLNKVSEVSRLDQLVAHLTKNTKVPILDLRPALAEAGRILRTYHATDTHWNDYGGYIGYRSLMERLKLDFPELRPLELRVSDFVTVDTPGGDLAQMLDMQDALREQRIQPSTQIERCARNPTLGPQASNEQRFKHSFTTYCDSAPYRVLMFRDSYSFAMMPYLSESFGYIHYNKHTPAPVAGLTELVRQHKPDLVIEQRSSRWLRTPQG